jgi:hypothetical protein
MQLFFVIDQTPIQVCLYRLVNVGDVCHDGTYACLLDALVGASAHAARQQSLTVCDSDDHLCMATLRRRIETMPARILSVGLWHAWRARKLGMTHLVTPFAAHNLPVLYRDD